MAEYKQIKTRIWQDNWFLSLNPEEKIIWLFLLTNEYCHLSGLYELPKPLISSLTGVIKWQEALKKFEQSKKIVLIEDWVFIVNKSKHQPISKNMKDNVNISIQRYLEENKEIHKMVLEKLGKFNKGSTKGLQRVSETLPKIEIEIESKIEKEIEIREVDENRPKPPSPKEKAIKFFSEETFRKEIATKIQEKTGVELKLILKEINNFCNYWLELNKLGTKRRWEMQQTFEVDRRLLTWFNNIDQFKKQTKGKTIIL
jgi:hypothetical protein